MKEDKLVEFLEPIETRYKQDYSTQERKMLYARFFWMTDEMFQDLCGLVLATDSFRIPAVNDFSKIQISLPDRFRRIQKVEEPCEICKATGVRRFLQIGRDKRHAAPAARCDCGNGKKWTHFPSIEVAKRLVGFVRWLRCHESDFGAVVAADRALGTGVAKGKVGEKSEDGVNDKVPSRGREEER